MGFITISGENQIANKQGNSETLNITQFVLANIDGLDVNNEPVNRVEAMPAAGDIMDTLPVTKQGYVNTNQVVYSLVMDSSIGDYDFNWVGLIDDEGELIAVTYTPLIQKRKTAGSVPGNNLTRNFLIAFSGIQATTAIAVPAETWQIDFNARLHGIDERERLSNFDIYGHEGFLGDGWKVERVGTSSTYNVLPGVGYVGGIRIADTLTQQITATGPKSVWLDVSLQGDISDMSAVVDFVIDAVAHADYTDANGFKHYLTEISDIAANGSVTDTRVDGDGLGDHLDADDPHSQYLLKSNTVTQAAAEAGTDTTAKSWTAQRVRQAINAVVKSATESVAGIAKRATQALVDAGDNDTDFVTPKKLKWGVSYSFTSDGYIVFPSWMASFKIQWGLTPAFGPGTGVTVTFPTAHTTSVFSILSTTTIVNSSSGGSDSQTAFIRDSVITNSSFQLLTGGTATLKNFWISLGI